MFVKPPMVVGAPLANLSSTKYQTMKRKLWSYVRRDSSQKVTKTDIFQMATLIATIFILAIATPMAVRYLFKLFS